MLNAGKALLFFLLCSWPLCTMWFLLGVSGSGHSTNTSSKCKYCVATSFFVTFLQVIPWSSVHLICYHPGDVFMLVLLNKIVLAIMAACRWHLQHPVCGRRSVLIQEHLRGEGEPLKNGVRAVLPPVYFLCHFKGASLNTKGAQCWPK